MNLLGLRLPLRRRRLDEIFDLALIVLRTNGWRYARIALPVCGVFLILNFALLGMNGAEDPSFQNALATILLLAESSLLQLFLVAVNGRIVFEEKPRFRDVLKDLRATALRYIFHASILNTLMYTVFLFLILPPVYALFAQFFLGEVLILERLSGKPMRKRAHALARGHWDRIGGFYLFSVFFFVCGLIAAVYTASSLREILGPWAEKRIAAPVLEPRGMIFQLTFFPAMVYFTLCRFLLYLDLRIANEGWDIELLLLRGIEETEAEPEARAARRRIS